MSCLTDMPTGQSDYGKASLREPLPVCVRLTPDVVISSCIYQNPDWCL